MKLVIGIVLSIAAVLLLGSAFAPVLCRSRESANRVKCASNLRQIGTAIALYAHDNGDATPDSFATLVTKTDLVSEAFTCASSSAERAESPAILAAAPTPKNCSYTYVGDGLLASTMPANAVLMVEDLDNHDRDGVNILYGDGHVEFLMVNRRTPPKWWISLQEQMQNKTRPVMIVGGT